MRCWRLIAGLVLAFAASSACVAQTAGFEVSTVKPTPPVNDGRTHIVYPPGGDFAASNVTLLGLVAWAFDLPENRVLNAPDWTSRQRFDLQAKTDAATDAAMRAMSGDDAHALKRRLVQALLRDRFALKTHSDTQTLNALDLLVDGKAKLVESTASGKKWDLRRSSLHGYGLTMDILAEQLGRIAGKVVVDRTGLEGHYDVTLEWTPDDGSAAANPNAPGFFRAVPEQLGLKLVPAKEPLDVLVVDAVAQPSAN